MKSNIRLFFLALFSLCTLHTATAQLDVSGVPMTIPGGPQTYQQMIQQLFGNGVVVSNLTINCDTTQDQAGWFVANNTNLGLTNGMLLTSGAVQGAVGPNNSSGNTVGVTNGPGDALLNQISSATTYDACGIEFDLIPYCDTISLQYVFGSEEYMEFVNAGFNDVFGFFISGPNPAGGNYVNFNIARIPGTAIPVTIDNVNCNTNNAYYVCNEPASAFGCNLPSCPPNANTTTIQYDGLTAVLDAVAAVVPCMSYHIKIAVADAGDGILDSGVFLQAGGVQCASGIINVSVGNTVNNTSNVAIEGCVDGYFNFSVNAPSALADTFYFTVGGTAQPNGVDYVGQVPTSIIMPAGQTTINIPVQIVNDGLAEGVEYIQLIYTDSTLCASQIVQDTFYLYIFDPAVINAGADKVICSGMSTGIGGGGNPMGYSYNWSPNTGIANPNSANTTVTLTNTGTAPVTYTYILTGTAQGLNACIGRDTVLITVEPVSADFSVDAVCYGFPTTFTNLSTTGFSSYTWLYGDNTTGNSANASHTHSYGSSGAFTATLLAFSPLGCVDTVVKPVTVYEKPDAQFNAPPVCYPLASSFTDQSTPAAGINAWSWDFGSGGATSNMQNPSFAYPNGGSFNVQLIVATPNGCRDTVTQSVSTYPQVFADFNAPNVCYGFNADFTNASNAPAVNFTWDFGDSNTSNATNPSHFYAQNGTYNVTLISTSAQGCADTLTKPITIYEKPLAGFSIPPFCSGSPSTFVDNSSPVTVWEWSFGDGGTASLQNPPHIYAVGGNYNTTLLVTTADGCKDTLSQNTLVYQTPTANFPTPAKCIVDASLFTYSGLQGSGPVVSYLWDFGDGSQLGLGAPVSHTYPGFGNYNVTLYIADINGCKDTITKPITIYPMPVVDFAMPNDCQESDISFTNNSSIPFGNISQYLWQFGDNNSSNLPAPTHAYQNAGVFTVKLTATSDQACELTVAKDVVVYPRPNPDFTYSPTCEGIVTYFTNLTLLSPIVADDYVATWDWAMGDGTTDNVQAPQHLYAAAGTYMATLRAVTDKNCDRSITKPVLIAPNPESPTVTSDTVCLGKDATLFAFNGTNQQMYWYQTATDTLPFHTGNSLPLYNNIYPRTYFVQTVNNQRCKSAKIPVYLSIYPQNPAEIVVSNPVLETPNAVANLSVQSFVPILQYLWNFGDNSPKSELPQPAHEYVYPGIYDITVNLTDENGCRQEVATQVEVKEVFSTHIPSAFTPNGDNSNDAFQIGAHNMAKFYIEIYDRWGKMVFESEDTNFRWDGHDLKGNVLPEGVYVYKVSGTSVHNKRVNLSGTITLMR